MLGEGQGRTRERFAPEGGGHGPAAAAERQFAFGWSFVEPAVGLGDPCWPLPTQNIL